MYFIISGTSSLSVRRPPGNRQRAQPHKEIRLAVTSLDTYRRAKQAADKAHKQDIISQLGEPTSNFYRISHLTTSHPAYIALSPSAKLLLLTLCKHRNRYQRRKAYFTRSLRQLSSDTGLAVNTLRKCRIELSDARFITTANRKSGRIRWQIIDVKQIRI